MLWVSCESSLTVMKEVSNTTLVLAAIRSLSVPASLVLDQLDELLRLRSNCVALCNEASRFRQTSAFRRLLLNTAEEHYGSWHQVRHYLGRLGTWRKAAQHIATSGPMFYDVLVGCQVQVLPMGSKSAPPLPAFDEDPEIVLSRAFPTYRNSAIFADALAKIHEASEGAKYLHRAAPAKAPHAEAVVLHHFRSRALEFAYGDRYVGCSKPSCYGCRMYFESHPNPPRVGRTHDNVWIKWCLPRPMASHNSMSDGVRVEIVRRMVNLVYKDLRDALVRNRVLCSALFDSTTGLTTSLASSRPE
jgi:hypothetical protein